MSTLLRRLDLGPGYNALRLPIALLLLVAGLNLAVYFVLTRPAWRDSAAASSATAVNQQVTGTITPQLERARRVYGRIASAEESLAELRARVGTTSGTAADVVSSLRAALDAAGLRAERVTYAPQPVAELGLTQLQVNLPVRGDYGALRAFLDALLDGPMFVVLERISASAPSQGDPTGQLLLGITASAFIASDDLPAPGAEPGEPDEAVSTGGAAGGDPVAEVNRLADRLRGLPQIPLPDEDFQVGLARLDAEREPATRSRRDLFSFAAERAPQRARELAAAEPVQDDFVPLPVLPYDLIGVNRTDAGLLATLVDGDLVLVVREGDILPDGYRVLEIKRMSVLLESGLTRSELSLRPNDR